MSVMLIVIGGLPQTGKTSLARGIAQSLDAVYLHIDNIEQAIRSRTSAREPDPATAYAVGYAVAADNLQLGRTVVADGVHPLTSIRVAWREVAQRAGVALVEVEVICTDVAEHRRRIVSRNLDGTGLKLPALVETDAPTHEPWTGAHVVIDTSRRSAERSVTELYALLLVRDRAVR